MASKGQTGASWSFHFMSQNRFKMSVKPLQICTKIPQNRLKTAFYMALFAFLTTFLIEYLFIQSWRTNLVLGLGTGFCGFICIYILHYFVFSKIRSVRVKYFWLLAFPILYLVFLISTFGFVTLMLDLTLFQVPFINQIYLQIWAFLGKAYIYATFSPKIPFLLTSFLVMVSFFLALKLNHTQTHQD